MITASTMKVFYYYYYYYYYYYVEQLNLKNNKRIGPDYRVCLDTIGDYIKED